MGKGKKGGGVRLVQKKQPSAAAMKDLMQNPMDALQIPPEEMVNLPPKPDRSYQIVWPIQESFSMNFDQFITIYPSYLDATKTIKQGRRIPKDLAVPTPTVSDMSLILQRHNYRHVLQPYKGYSRDSSTLWDNPGRVKVDCVNTNKMELLKLLASEIPDLPERQARLAQEAKEKEVAEQKALEEANQARRLAEAKKVQAAQAQSSKGSSNNKKKGKKKR